MEQFHSIFIISFIVFLIYMYYENSNNEVVYVVSNIDNGKYLVRNVGDNQKAADLLARTKGKLLRLCEYLKGKYEKRDGIDRLINRFNPDRITEAGKDSKYTSYSINKGEKIVLCLRSRDDKEQIVDDNTLMFVALHELSHIMTKSIGHTKEFWRNFKFLLKRGMEIGIYTHEDYNNQPKEYCGITVTDTPLNDSSIKVD